jgi:beta-phosphoglucomutase-like phosphatase (HAD superfamily)
MPAKRKHTIEGVLFDWDGTLINSYQADTSAYLAMFREMGIAWGIEDLEKHYSPNWYHVYRAAGLPKKQWAEADRAWRTHYAKQRP